MTDGNFEFGVSDPKDFGVEQVNAALDTYRDHDADNYQAERERVLGLEVDGKARTTILEGPHALDSGTPEDDDEPAYDDVTGVDTTSAFIIPNHNTVPQALQDEDAAARNAELEDAGVNQAQGFIGSDGSANLLG
jgi:hypothetical protein